MRVVIDRQDEIFLELFEHHGLANVITLGRAQVALNKAYYLLAACHSLTPALCLAAREP